MSDVCYGQKVCLNILGKNMTSNKKSIFDTEDTADLPRDLQVGPGDRFGYQIMELFEYACEEGLMELNVNQVMVAFHRKFRKNYSKLKTNVQIMNKLFAMAKGKKFPLEKVDGKNGTYRLKK